MDFRFTYKGADRWDVEIIYYMIVPLMPTSIKMYRELGEIKAPKNSKVEDLKFLADLFLLANRKLQLEYIEHKEISIGYKVVLGLLVASMAIYVLIKFL